MRLLSAFALMDRSSKIIHHQAPVKHKMVVGKYAKICEYISVSVQWLWSRTKD